MRAAVLEQLPMFVRANLLNLKELYQGNKQQELEAKDGFW
jgi:hypothetical protein